MSDQSIKDKIRKLLALGENEGATESEASSAMTMAAALMMKYGVDESEVRAKRHEGMTVTSNEVKFPTPEPIWVIRLARACSTLNTVETWYSGRGQDVCSVTFAGNKANCEAAVDMFVYLKAAVERAYKDNMKAYTATIRHYPRGEQVKLRGEFRQTFKFACASRVNNRAYEIVERLKTDDKAAQQATGKNALVIVESIDQQMRDIQTWMQSLGMAFKTTKVKAKVGSGTVAGQRAGDGIKINKELS